MRAGVFSYAAGDSALIRDFAPGRADARRFLFPATYELPRHPVASELTAEMVHKFQKRNETNCATIGNGAGDHRLMTGMVTMASLVDAKRRSRKSGRWWPVPLKRIRRACACSAMPTVIYGMERRGKYNGSLTGRTELRISVQHLRARGFLPGRLEIPGKRRCVPRCIRRRRIIFILWPNTRGGHFFSATLAEHNKMW